MRDIMDNTVAEMNKISIELKELEKQRGSPKKTNEEKKANVENKETEDGDIIFISQTPPPKPQTKESEPSPPAKNTGIIFTNTTIESRIDSGRLFLTILSQ